jgi:PEGA domain/Family of unknown function (DUF5683)
MKFFMILLLINLFYGFNSHGQENKINELNVIGKAVILSEEIISNEIRDVNGNVCSGLLIQTDLSGLTFESNNGIVKIDSNPGEYLLYLSRNERVVKIRSQGFKPLQIILYDYGINLSSGKVWKIEITGDKKLDLIPINIITSPAEANITIDGMLKGSWKTFQVSEGEHDLKIEKDGYKIIEQGINVSASNNLFNFRLDKVNLVLVTIKSVPEGAKIVIENSEKGITNEQIFEYPGTYKIKLIKSGYLTLEETITVREGVENNFSYRLNKNTGTISFTVNPRDAEIRIDTELQTSKVINLLPGIHNIEITKDGYISQSDKLEVELGEIFNKDYILEKNSVSVSLIVVPNDAKVLFNKKDYSGKKLIDISPGRYQLEISKNGYFSIEEMIIAELGNPITKNYSLVEKVGILQFKIKPINAKINLLKNGKEITNWVGSKIVNDLMIGNYELKAVSEGYKPTNLGIVIEENKTTIKDINLEISTHSPNVESLQQYTPSDYGTIANDDFSRSSAILQSTIIPGLGQITNSSSRGWLYSLGAIGAGVYYYMNVTEHNDNIAKYDELVQNYVYNKTEENRTAASDAYDKADKSLSTTYLAMGILGVVYAVNLIDVLSFDPPKNSLISNAELKPTIKIVSQNKYLFGIDLRLAL